jgi:peptide/nickel transport system substrate-binding protein
MARYTRQIIRQSFRMLTLPEKIIFWTAAAAFVLSGTALLVYFAATHTVRIPASGGSYTEAETGGPRFINPALAPANDADRDLSRLIYSGLMRYDSDGKVVTDMAESYSVSTDSKVFTFTLRPDLKWQDGLPLTLDDVIFTIRLVQNPDFQSPVRFGWQGVRIEKKNDLTVSLVLPNSYEPFLSYATLGIIPKHLWQDVSPQGFALSDLNLKPVGSGPFSFKSLNRRKDGAVTSITLARNENYYGQKAWLDSVTFNFYDNREDALAALENGEADGFGGVLPDELNLVDVSDSAIHNFALPRIFAVFFNQTRSKILARPEVREALDYATDRESLSEAIYHGSASPVYGPVPPAVFGYTESVVKRQFDKDKAGAILEKAGWKLQPDGARMMSDVKRTETVVNRKKTVVQTVTTTTLEFSLLTADLPELQQAASILKDDWEAIGAKVDVEVLGVADIQGERVRPRDYDAVLFGEVLGMDPDPYSFWHSTQRRDPGLNLALYDDPKVDRMLEDARSVQDSNKRMKLLADFQKSVTEDIPAIFLFSPRYLYAVSPKIHNIGSTVIAAPQERFNDAARWYVKTTRAWK